MAWNIEVACIQDATSTSLAHLVPDVFAETDQVVHFEDATSSSRGTDLCAAHLSGYTVIIDTMCRLTGISEYLAQISRGREIYVARISDTPLEIQFSDGKKSFENEGIDAALDILGREKPKNGGYIDGEELAVQLLKLRTQLVFPFGEFWDAQFTVFQTG